MNIFKHLPKAQQGISIKDHILSLLTKQTLELIQYNLGHNTNRYLTIDQPQPLHQKYSNYLLIHLENENARKLDITAVDFLVLHDKTWS